MLLRPRNREAELRVKVIINLYIGIMLLVCFGAGMAIANKLRDTSTGYQVHHHGKSTKAKTIKRPEGDPWTCFGGGRYQAMAEGKVCPGWEDL